MNNGGDAAEQIVRLSLEGFEVAAKLTGSAAKNIAVLLASTLKQEINQSHKTKGKARLSNMLKSGKELKVFAIQNKDLPKFVEQAKRYGVLYCVLRDKSNSDPNATVDIIARAEDASKIQRISDRFELGKVDKVSIVSEVEKSVAEKEAVEIEVPTKSKGELIIEEAMGKSTQKEGNSHENPTVAKTDKNPPSERSSGTEASSTKGTAERADKKPYKIGNGKERRYLMKKIKLLYYIGIALSMLVGIWHFFVPYMFQWYSYIPNEYGNLIVGIDWTNFFFSLLLTGISLLLILFCNKVFNGNGELFVFYGFLIFVWFCRVIITFIEPWPLEPIAWAAYGQQIAAFVIFIVQLIPFIYLLKQRKFTNKAK